MPVFYDWNSYPVLRLDMGSCQADTVERFWGKVRGLLIAESERNGVALRKDMPITEQFKFLIQDLALKPDSEGQPGAARKQKRMVLLLDDITMDARFATLFGYTREEVKANFPGCLVELAESNGLTGEEAFAKLEEMYDGFKFHPKAKRVFNPVSVGKCLSQKEFGRFWFETGTPSFLVELLMRNPIGEEELAVTASDLSAAYEPEQVWILPLMVQTGYLTIKSAKQEGDDTVCTLGYPNREVEGAMSKYLVQGYSCARREEFGPICNRIYNGLAGGEPDEVLEGVKCFFENIPYDLQVKYEKYYQSLFVSIFLMLKARVWASGF